MNGFICIFLLYLYYRFSKINGVAAIDTIKVESTFGAKLDQQNIKLIDEDVSDDDIDQDTANNRKVKLDVDDIDLALFDVTDEYHNSYLTKFIKLNDHTKIVKIVDQNVVIHEPEIGETFIDCSIRSNKLDLYLRYQFRDEKANLSSIIFYKANGNWYTLPEKEYFDWRKPFGFNKCPLEIALRFADDIYDIIDEPEINLVQSPEETDLTQYCTSVESMYVRFKLDINAKEENEKYNFRNCYIHDNHSLIYIIKSGYRVSSIFDDSILVDEIKEGIECFFVQVLLEKEKPKFLLTLSYEKTKVDTKYYEKNDGAWKSITSDDYYRDIANYKKIFADKCDTELDIRTHRDTDEVLFIDSDYGNIHTHVFAPMPGYSFKKIGIKDSVIWEKKGKEKNECHMVLVRFLHNFPNKVHLVMPSGVDDHYYHLKMKQISYKIRKYATKTEFEGDWSEVDEEKYSNDMIPLMFMPPIKFPSNRFILDINSKNDNEIHIFRHGYPMGVETYFYMAKDGYKIAIVKDSDKDIWKAKPTEFASFIVVLLTQNSSPILARIVTFDEHIQSKHRYYIKLKAGWSEIDSFKYKNNCDKLYTFVSGLKNDQKQRSVTVDLKKNYSPSEIISLRYRFDGMNTKVLIPHGNTVINTVKNGLHEIWKRKKHDCLMIICRYNSSSAYFVNIVKSGESSDEFFFVERLQDPMINEWEKVEFDHIYVEIKEFKLKPYIQHSYKEHQIDINSETHDPACTYKVGYYYNVPSSFYIMKTGNGITKVLDNGKEIWRSKNGEYASYLVSLYAGDAPRLLFIMVNNPSFEIVDLERCYLEKKDGVWGPMYGDVEFNFVLNKMEIVEEYTLEFELDINYMKDDERVTFFDDVFGVRNIILYFPTKDYRLRKLTDGNNVVLETGLHDYMISVKVYIVQDKPYLIRIRYRDKKMCFKDFEKVQGKWVEISNNAFLVKTMILNDVLFSEVNVLKSTLFDKVYTKLGSDATLADLDLADKIRNSFGHSAKFDAVDDEDFSTPVEEMFDIISSKIKENKTDKPRYIQRPDIEKDECVLNISDINLDRFTFYDNIYADTKHRVVDNNYECKVIKVIDHEGDIHNIKENQELFRCHIYNRNDKPEMLDIFTYDMNHRLNHYIYVKNKDGVWDMSYWRQSDLLYKLYRYMSRPVKKHVPLELGYVDDSNFQAEEKRFASYVYHTISPNADVNVTRVTHHGMLVHTIRKDQTLVWCSYNQMGSDDDVVDLFVTDLDGKLFCYSYKRDAGGWNLSYTHKSAISSLDEFSSSRFKSLVNHKLIDTCDGEILESEKHDFELNINTDFTVRYSLDDVPCLMFKPRKTQNVTRVVDNEDEILNSDVLRSKTFLSSFLYYKDGVKSALFLFLIDQDGNIERIKYYRVAGKWTLHYLAPQSFDKTTYELDNVSNKEVVEYLDDSFNCKFTKDLEDAVAKYKSDPTIKPYFRPPMWILDLNDVDKKKFKVTRSTKDSREFIHISPRPFVLVDRIMYDNEIIYDVTPGDMLDRVNLTVDDHNEYEISCDVESPDGTLRTFTRKSSDKSDPSMILYTPINRSLYRPGNLYEIAGSHILNIANLSNHNCTVNSVLIRGHIIKKFKVDEQLLISRVFEGVKLINILRPNYKLTNGIVLYNKGPVMVIFKSQSTEKQFDQHAYVKLDSEWKLVENYQTERYIKSLYPDGKYFTTFEIGNILNF